MYYLLIVCQLEKTPLGRPGVPRMFSCIVNSLDTINLSFSYSLNVYSSHL